MEEYSNLVIELYKNQFSDYVSGSLVNVDRIFEVQTCLSKAIDKATINNLPTDYLEKLKKDVDYLKYQILV